MIPRAKRDKNLCSNVFVFTWKNSNLVLIPGPRRTGYHPSLMKIAKTTNEDVGRDIILHKIVLTAAYSK
eukprot:328866-Amphidinium_carterae.1